MTTDKLRVGIVGASGYAGTELLRLLHGHPHVEVTYVAGNHGEDEPWSEVRPYFPHYQHLQMQAYDIDVCVRECDLVFVALPSGVSGSIAVDLWRRGLKAIDLSGDLRLTAGEYEQWYQKPACDDAALQSAVYGLTEWNRQAVAKASLVSNPGCYATAILLALKPLAEIQGQEGSMPVLIDAKSGISGAGKKSNANFLHGELDDNFYAYRVGTHQHTPEVQRYAGMQSPILMTTQLLPTARGIYASCYIHLQDDSITDSDIYEIYQKSYENEFFVNVQPIQVIPQLKHVRGSNHCHIGFRVDLRTKVLQVFSALDNLQKGAAGQAVQNMNVMMGYPESNGLEALPMYP